ncbi:MAG TPA: molybdopterin oxidoreductase [Leucothrix mucor]|uniref:Molybdopterin oxidoreductase n=1 Tax=Leucothrix mucor TaxID=45248 RepID=A0A7V2T2A3_LEUMU|nr:molybdopterin oxidoreductase [Leucothrix mucor]
MNNRIVFSEAGGGLGFVVLLAITAGLAGIGFLAFLFMEHSGHYVTGMDNQIVWGLPHVFAIFLIVAASGAANIGSVGTVFGKKIYQPLGRLSVVTAMALLVGGLLVLVLDLGHPDRLIVAMTSFNFKSIFTWNIMLYSGFLGVMAFYLWTMMDRSKLAKSLYKPAGYLSFVWRFVLTMGTGSIFGFLVARQYYDAAIMAPLFIVLSYVLGTAIYILVLMAAYKWTKRELGDAVLNRLRYTLAIFIGAVLFFELVRHLTNLYATEHHGIEGYILLHGGLYTFLFWGGQIVLGSLVPMFLVWCKKLENNRLALAIAAVLAIFGGLSLLYNVLIGGQSYPLVLFPNAIVESAFSDGVINSYTPSLPELVLGIGGVGVTLLVIVVGVKVLRLLPESLADSVADPHHK